MKNIKTGNWLQLVTKASEILNRLQSEISRLSFIDSNEIAIQLIDKYFMNIIVRYIAIHKTVIQSKSVLSIGSFLSKSSRSQLN